MSDTYYSTNCDMQLQDKEKVERSRFLEPKVRMIFILSILQLICNILFNIYVGMISIELYYIGLFGGLLVGIVYGIIMLVMAKENTRFKIAGICYVFLQVLTIFMLILGDLLVMLGGIIRIVLPFVAMYQEIYGYSDTLSGINNTLAKKWVNIWKNMITWLIVLFVSGLVLYINPLLGMIPVIVSAIAVIIFSIMRLVCMVDTANAFEKYIRFHQ